MSSHAVFDRIELEICRRGQVANVINSAKFLKIVPKYTALKMVFPFHDVLVTFIALTTAYARRASL